MARTATARVASAPTPRSARRRGSFLERGIEGLARRAEVEGPERPAMALFVIVMGLVSIGLLVQASHAATTTYAPDELTFHGVLLEAVRDRGLAILVLLLAYRLGPTRLRPFIPVLVVLSIVMLVCVFVPGIGNPRNGSHRWITVPLVGLSVQPSEVARIFLLCWVADRCVRLGDGVRDVRRGVLPILLMGLSVFGLILVETDLGGSMLFLICFLCTMWVGGARPLHVASSLLAVGGGAALLAFSRLGYVRGRIATWFGQSDNGQVDGALSAMASGDLWGVGLGQGRARNDGVPYLDSDYVFAQVGEELGLCGTVIGLALLIAFTWYGMRLVLSIRDRYCALAAFGLLMSVALQAMLHVQVVTGLAPPKGINLPFVSSGGTSLVVSALAVGLALGAARSPRRQPPPAAGEPLTDCH